MTGPAVTRAEEPGFAQQAAGIGSEAGKIEPAGQRPVGLRRRQAVTGIDPGFCRQVFQVDPDVAPALERVQIGRRQPAAERFDHDIGGDHVRYLRTVKGANLDPVDALRVARRVHCGDQWRKPRTVVDRQRHVETVRGNQQARKPPADTRVPVVVDDAAENIETLHLAPIIYLPVVCPSHRCR